MEKIVLLDMDGVLADFEQGFFRRWRTLYPDLSYVHPQERKTFEIYGQYPRELAIPIYQSPGFFHGLELIPGAHKAVTVLSQVCHLYICTSPLTQYQHCLKEKLDWVVYHFGPHYLRKVIIAKDKTVVRGDYLIDDRPMLSGELVPTWEHVVYDQPYNQATDTAAYGKRRLHWQNYRWLLEELA